MRAGRRWCTAALACSALVLSGCTSAGLGDAAPGRDDAEPWPDRPVVDLRFEVAPDLATVAGREVVEFTPDLDTCELVFRSWPNNPATARAGSSLTVSDVRADGRDTAFFDIAAGARGVAPAGPLVEVPREVSGGGGETVTAELTFALVLGEEVD